MFEVGKTESDAVGARDKIVGRPTKPTIGPWPFLVISRLEIFSPKRKKV
jgi:hypothetical protein